MSDEASTSDAEDPRPEGETEAPRRFADLVCDDGNNQMIALVEGILTLIRDNLVVAVDIIVTDIDGDPILGHCSLQGVPTAVIVGGFELAKEAYIRKTLTAGMNESIRDFANAVVDRVILDKVAETVLDTEEPQSKPH